MHHPGPPRVLDVDESRQLAPSNPIPGEEYHWRVSESPEGAAVSLGDGPVVEFDPSRPGRYKLELEAPDGVHELTALVLESERKRVTVSRPKAEIEGEDPPEEIPIIGLFNNYTLGRDYATLEGDEYVFEQPFRPGLQPYCMTNGENFDNDGPWRETIVSGPGRPNLALSVTRTDEEVVVAPETRRPDGTIDDDIRVEYVVDDRDDAALELDARRAIVPNESLANGDVRVYAVAVAERRSAVRAVRIGESTVEFPARPPEWIRDAFIYEIDVGSFGPSFDDLRERVSYLDELGVDCVWLTPITSHDGGKHGYRPTDLTTVASDFGTLEAFEAFVADCHDRGIRVVFDLVITHASVEHPKFQNAVETEADREWFNWVGNDHLESDHEYRFDWDETVNFNYESLEVRRHMLDVVDFWAERVDGFRCDFARGVPRDFWKQVRERTKARDPEFLLIGEALPSDPVLHEFDAQYGMDLFHRLLAVGRGNEPATALLDIPDERREKGFGGGTSLLHYIEDHDLKRYKIKAGADPWPAAFATTFTLPGIPKVYAGQELGVTEQRGPLPWDDVGNDAYRLHRAIIDCYHDRPALRRGDVEAVGFEGDSDRVVAFERVYEDDRVVVVLNFGSEPTRVTLSADVSRDLIGDEPIGQSFVVDSVRVLE